MTSYSWDRSLLKCCHVFTALSCVDLFARVGYLRSGQFSLASEFHTPALRVLYSGAGALAFRHEADHLPHGAACRCFGVDYFRERAKFHAALFEVVKDGYQVAQAAA
jgi:hypothetical protein